MLKRDYNTPSVTFYGCMNVFSAWSSVLPETHGIVGSLNVYWVSPKHYQMVFQWWSGECLVSVSTLCGPVTKSSDWGLLNSLTPGFCFAVVAQCDYLWLYSCPNSFSQLVQCSKRRTFPLSLSWAQRERGEIFQIKVQDCRSMDFKKNHYCWPPNILTLFLCFQVRK